jgi:hypothetical protein
MPRGPAPAWRARKPPVRDDYLLASIQGAEGRHHPETGQYAQLVIAGCASLDEAKEEIRALHRSANHLSKWKLTKPIGVFTKIRKNGGAYDVEFTVVDKSYARKFVVDRYGPDPSKWPYLARRKGNPES